MVKCFKLSHLIFRENFDIILYEFMKNNLKFSVKIYLWIYNFNVQGHLTDQVVLEKWDIFSCNMFIGKLLFCVSLV